MITLTREEAQSVLDAVEDIPHFHNAAIETLRARLSAPEPKPSAWAVQEGVNLHDVFLFKDEADEMCHLKGDHAKAMPLYTAPPQRKWQGLTEQEVGGIMEDLNAYGTRLDEFARAIEAKLKEKNND